MDGEYNLPGSDGHKVGIVGWGRDRDTPGAPVVQYGMVWYGMVLATFLTVTQLFLIATSFKDPLSQ